MSTRLAKSLERSLKRLTRPALLFLLSRPARKAPAPADVRKVLVFRLDQRIGNGILLLPLLRSLRASRPDAEIHLLIHRPVAELFRLAAPGLVDRIRPYDQPAMMRRPWSYLGLIAALRRERFDAVLTSHNPDNVSLSQALAGRLIRPRWLIGFDWEGNGRFYDVPVSSSADKPYAEAMVDLWRAVDPEATVPSGHLRVPPDAAARLAGAVPQAARGGVLVWLGATGSKGLPPEVLACVLEHFAGRDDLPVQIAAGPADAERLARYPAAVRERALIWKRPLTETAAFLAAFRLVVSGDTGPMHLAAALGVPTLTVFVRSSMRQYGYRDGGRHRSLAWKGTEEDRRSLGRLLESLVAGPSPGAEEAGRESRKGRYDL
jgi:ADP-heptose:LPS heptosyltransferase